jgi:hypothetical protein
MATQALLRLGHMPLSMDSDRCELCQAIKSGFMAPERCFVLDARLLPRFFPSKSFDIVMGFMVGLIDMSNWPYWRDILLKASNLAKEQILFTVYTQKEAEIIEIQRSIRTRVEKEMGDAQKEFILREQLKAIQQELGDRDGRSSEIEEYKGKFTESKMPGM